MSRCHIAARRARDPLRQNLARSKVGEQALEGHAHVRGDLLDGLVHLLGAAEHKHAALRGVHLARHGVLHVALGGAGGLGAGEHRGHAHPALLPGLEAVLVGHVLQAPGPVEELPGALGAKGEQRRAVLRVRLDHRAERGDAAAGAAEDDVQAGPVRVGVHELLHLEPFAHGRAHLRVQLARRTADPLRGVRALYQELEGAGLGLPRGAGDGEKPGLRVRGGPELHELAGCRVRVERGVVGLDDHLEELLARGLLHGAHHRGVEDGFGPGHAHARGPAGGRREAEAIPWREARGEKEDEH
mmetsp:Transcript_13239/g.44893  ORF Transcript_13239/g.44893 Transcript_13239/m.44893 type:complete len:300 (+) Transcript_13239:215-1114(+)